MLDKKICLPHQLYYPVLDVQDRLGRNGQTAYTAFLDKGGERGSAIIYVHIPFCRTICEFCTFDRTAADLASRIQPYLARLHAEIDQYARTRYVANSRVMGVHIGGGTPSVLDTRDLEALLAMIRERFRLSDDVPVDIEAAIPTLTEEKLAGYRALGIRKVSFGVQTFHPEVRRAMNLNSGVEKIRHWSERLRDRGFVVFLDLMYGLPGQDARMMLEDVRLATELEPDGIEHSQYYPFGSPYWAHNGSSHGIFLSNDAMTKSLAKAWRELESRGYKQKSSYMFCRRHDNMLDFAYHGSPAEGRPPEDCIGLGSSAYGFVGPFHYRNLWQDEYLRHDAAAGFPLVHLGCSDDRELQDRRVILFPRVLALMKSTVDGSTVERFRRRLDLLQERGFLAEDVDSIRLTPRGRVFFDNVMWGLYPDEARERIGKRVWRLG